MIERKIEEIRNMPEHIRMRYLWVSVFFSMVLILFLWTISTKDTLTRTKPSGEEFSEFSEILQDRPDNTPSLEEFFGDENESDNNIAEDQNNEILNNTIEKKPPTR